jgi:DNA-directed RNA polymerase II subunit RPB2
MLDLFIPSVHDAGMIMTQRNALQYIAILTKGKTIAHTLEILSDYFLPHVGEVNFINKAYYLGYIVFRLLSVYTGLEPSTDRDNFKYKRIELVGTLMSDLFREYYTLQQRQVQLSLEEIVHYNESIYADNLYGLIDKNYKEVFRERILETGFKKAFKGNWGSQSHTKRIGIVQDLNRLSFNSALSHLRKTNLPLDASVKLVGPRVLHSTQWGMFDPIDTPDGGNIGIHKHISISAYITQGISREPFIQWLREKIDMKKIEDCSPLMLANMTKILLNGLWAGSISSNPFDVVKKIKLFRRNALIPIYISVTFDIKQRTIFIYTDGGRICRPIFYRDDETSKMSFENKDIINKIKNDNFSWNDVISGFNKKIDGFKPNDYKMYELNELYEGIDVEIDPSKLERFKKNKAIIDYIDNNESEHALIAFSNEVVDNENQRHTHMEIHESFIFGMMCNLINFPENNPATRNSFSCGQSKQACSMYHTNYQVRMDKTAVLLSSGQIPLVKSRYLEYINNEENPYGENAIVAIMCYTGYNVEDAILINEGALKRGLFRTTYYSTYESHEEKTKSGDVTIEKLFTNIENDENVNGKKPGYDYSKLDQFGIIRENTPIDDKTILIGLAANNATNKSVKIDMSKTTKKGQLGIVDKTFITESEEGKRIAKVRVREERIPNIGDKMASRSGQKGTIGLVIPEDDMPFTKDGLRPDMIINPHAIPSRMTIGHLVECIIGKAAAQYGGFSDCTAFNNRGSKVGVFGEMLPKVGFHSSGNEILYNGMTGEQIESEIFIGPNYYMRLKHMVKDKINYRALGPRTALTKQPVAGRANDGGLRIGEMERDSVISHGAAEFLRESMMERGDKYYMAVCNKTGLLAIYNPSKNIFISPMADGPIKFVGSLTENDLRIDNVTKYGRSFSVVCIPYTLKLLIQELQTINIQMRIITEDNIEQLENLSYSNNIDKLMFTKNIQPQEIVNEIKSTLRKGAKDVNEYLLTPKHIEVKEPSPDFPDTSPAYEPSQEEEIIRNDDNSPPYNPFSDDNSPPYNPFSDDNIGPTTPSMSPPEDIDEINERIRQSNLQLRKDADIITEQYSVGEEVLFRGDFLPNRIWKIKSVGDRFITITTDNIQGLDDKDTIKVVTKIDIYRPNDFTYSEPNAESIRNYNEFTQKPNTMPTSGGGIQDGVPAINFAPVFKIMNGGNDFSSGEQANESISSGGETKMNTLTDLAIASSPQINIKPNNEKSGGSTIEKQEPLDFSKLIIKKV